MARGTRFQTWTCTVLPSHRTSSESNLTQLFASRETMPTRSIRAGRTLPQRVKANQDYFCEGMVQEIINALTALKGLHVASPTGFEPVF